MINDLDPTRQQKCAELARAMGFYIQSISERFKIWRLFDSKGNTVSECGVSSESEAWGDAPDYFTNHADCHALLAAMASEDSEIDSNEIVFLSELMKNYSYLWQPGKLEFNAGEVRSIIFRALTADPSVIAEAAWRSIQSTKQETT